MAKNGRLDLKINGHSKNRLLAKAKYMNLNLTNFLEKIADEHIVFLEPKLIDILKSYGYNLNTLVSIKDNEGCRNINTDGDKGGEEGPECESGGIER